MDEWIGAITLFIKNHQAWAGLLLFALAFAESLAFLSLLVPFTSIIIGTGAMVCGAGAILSPWNLILFGAAGAAAGDAVSYWAGRYFDDKIPRIWPFRNDPGLIDRGQRFFARWGVASVFIGRFFGPLRAIVPVVAGMMDMPQWKFQLANVASALVWLPALLVPGCLVGTALGDVANIGEKVFVYVFLFFIALSIIGGAVVWLRQRRKKRAPPP